LLKIGTDLGRPGAGLTRMAAVLAAAWLASLAPAAVSPAEARACTPSRLPDGRVDLTYDNFCASGDGDIVARGAADSDGRSARRLVIGDAASWREGHGVRIEHAGPSLRLDVATLSPDRGVAPKCSISGHLGDEDVRLCVAGLARETSFAGFDDLIMRVRTTAPARKGDLQIVLLDANDGVADKAVLDMPALKAGEWMWAAARLHRHGEKRDGAVVGGLERVVGFELRCRRNCVDRQVQIAAPELVTDHVTTVRKVQLAEDGGATLTLADPIQRSVAGARVFHDDTAAVRRWLAVAKRTGGAQLYAPEGVYYLSRDTEAVNDLRFFKDSAIACAGPRLTVFRNAGKARTGLARMFHTRVQPKDDVDLEPWLRPENISVSGCGFDMNGWNARDYLTAITVYGEVERNIFAENISITNNYFFDSDSPGRAGCDISQDDCRIHQRQYVVALVARDVVVADNEMRDGGRIKVGQPGQNIVVRGNRLDLVNDNAITFVDFQRDACRRIGGCVTENIRIYDNFIKDPVGAGIFFGGDGERHDGPDFTVRDVEIVGNEVTGHFFNGLKAFLPAGARDITISGNRIVRRRSQPDPPQANTRGVMIRAYGGRAANIAVTGNTVAAQGANATYTRGAIILKGKGFDGVTVSDNVILCDGCQTIDYGGVYLNPNTGRTDTPPTDPAAVTDTDVKIMRNRIVGARSGLTLSRNVDGLAVTENLVCGSTSDREAGLRFGARAAGEIARNVIEGGAGFGLECLPGGYDASAAPFGENYLIGNARRAYLNCPADVQAPTREPPAGAPRCAAAP